MSDIKVTHGFTAADSKGDPTLCDVDKTAREYAGLPCVLVWLKDFNALAADAERWRSHLIIAAKEKRLAEIAANFEEIKRDVESLSPSVGENASETVDAPERLESAISDTKRALTPPLTPQVDRANAAPSLDEQFPVGRQVKILLHVRDARGFIRETNNDFVRVERGDGGMYWFRPDEIELLPEAPAPWVPKVGERVLVVHLQAVGKVTKMAGPAHALVDIDGVVRGYCIENLRPAPTDHAPAEPSGEDFEWEDRTKDSMRVSLVTDAAMDEMRRKLAALESDLARVSGELGLPHGTGPAPGYLAGLVRERDEARAERDREAREFEQKAFLVAFAWGGDFAVDTAESARKYAAAARAAMFPTEGKS